MTATMELLAGLLVVAALSLIVALLAMAVVWFRRRMADQSAAATFARSMEAIDLAEREADANTAERTRRRITPLRVAYEDGAIDLEEYTDRVGTVLDLVLLAGEQLPGGTIRWEPRPPGGHDG